MRLRDFKGLLQTAEITLAEKKQAGGDQYIFDFTFNVSVRWRPGEHLMLFLRRKGVRGRAFRVFSVASAPDERVIRIAAHIPAKASAYKRALLALEIGDTVPIRGPFGWFTLRDESSPVLIIAGGIGITPVRALFKQLEKGNRRRVRLIHAGPHHLFRGELEGIAAADPNISVNFVSDADEAEEAATEYIIEYGSHGFFYISGAPATVRAKRNLLKSLGVKRRQIVNDAFLGY